MKKIIILFTCLAVSACIHAYDEKWKMQKRIDTATAIIHSFNEMPEDSIPPAILSRAEGLAIFHIFKGGFVIGARGGSGIVIARDPETGEWSGPSAISTGGMSIGFQIGAQEIDLILVLNNQNAIKALSQSTCTLGADISIAAGPEGRNVEISATIAAAIYSYSKSKGLFAGISIEGTALIENTGINEDFYGEPVSSEEILTGEIKRPESANKLYRALEEGIPVE